MGDRVSFILEIILRLKDQASTQLAAIRTQLKGINTDAKSTAAGIDIMNTSISSTTRRLGNLDTRMKEIAATVKQMGDDDDFAKMAAAVDVVGEKLNKITGKRKLQVEVEQVGAEPTLPGEPTQAPTGGRQRLDAKARLAEQQARVAEQEAKLANEQALAALNRARQQAAREGRVFEEQRPAPPEREQRTVNIDELFRIERRLNDEGKRRIIVISNETDEIIADIADRKTKRASKRAADAALGRAARDYLIAQAEAAQAGQTEAAAAEAGAKAAEEKAEADKQAAKDARNAARRKKRADDKAAAATEKEAEATEEAATVKKEEVEVIREQLPEVEKDIEGRKDLSKAQRRVVDELEGEIISIRMVKRVSDSLSAKIAEVTNRLDDGTTQFTRRLDEAGEEIKGSLMKSTIDPTLRKPGGPPALGGGSQGAGGFEFDDSEFNRFEDQFADFVDALGDVRPKLEDEIRKLRNMFRDEPLLLFDVEGVPQVSGGEDLLRAENLRREAEKLTQPFGNIQQLRNEQASLRGEEIELTARLMELERGIGEPGTSREFNTLQNRLEEVTAALTVFDIRVAEMNEISHRDEGERNRIAKELIQEANILEHGIEGMIEFLRDDTEKLEELLRERRELSRADPLLAGGEINVLLAELDQHIQELRDDEHELSERISDLSHELDEQEAEEGFVEGDTVDELNRLIERQQEIDREIAEATERQVAARETIQGVGIAPGLDILIQSLTEAIEDTKEAIQDEAIRIDMERERQVRERFSPEFTGALVTASKDDIAKIKVAAETMADVVEDLQEGGDDETAMELMRETFRLLDLAERLELGEAGLVERIEELKQSLSIMEEAQRADRPPGVVDQDVIEAQQAIQDRIKQQNEITERLTDQLEEGLITEREFESMAEVRGAEFRENLAELSDELRRLTGATENPERDLAILNLTAEIDNLKSLLSEQRLAQIAQATMLSEFEETPQRLVSAAEREEFAPQRDIGVEHIAARIDENTRALEQLEIEHREALERIQPSAQELQAFEDQHAKLRDIEDKLDIEIDILGNMKDQGEDVDDALLALYDQLFKNDQTLDELREGLKSGTEGRREIWRVPELERSISELRNAIDEDRQAIRDSTDAIKKIPPPPPGEGGGRFGGGGGLGPPSIGGGAQGAGGFGGEEDDINSRMKAFLSSLSSTTEGQVFRMRTLAQELQREVDKVDEEFDRLTERVDDFASGFGVNAELVADAMHDARFALAEGEISMEGIESHLIRRLPQGERGAPDEMITDIADQFREIFEGVDPRALIRTRDMMSAYAEETKELTDRIRSLTRHADFLDLGVNGLTERIRRNSEVINVVSEQISAAWEAEEDEEAMALQDRLFSLRSAVEDDERAIRDHTTKIRIDADFLADHITALEIDADRMRALETFGQNIFVAIEHIEAAGRRFSEVLSGWSMTERLKQDIERRGGPETIGGGAQGGGRGRPPKRPTAAAAGGPDDEDIKAQDAIVKDQERKAARLRQALVIIESRFQAVEEGLISLTRRFREGNVDEEKFLAISSELSKALDKIAKSVPVDWNTRAAEQFFDRARAASLRTREELERVRSLREIFGDDEDFKIIATAFRRIGSNIEDVNEALTVTRGGMQIFRREGERMKALGIEGLIAELEETERKRSALTGPRQLREELRQAEEARMIGGTPIEVSEGREAKPVTTPTIEREIQRLGSRISAQKEALRQLLELEVEARRVAPTREAAAAVEEADVETTNKQTEATKELIASTLALQQNMNRVHRDLASGRVQRDVAIGDFEELSRQFANLSRTKGLDALSGTARQLRGLTRQAKEAAQALRDQDKLADTTSKTTEAQQEQEEQAEALAARFEELDRQVEQGGLSAREASIHFGRLSREFNRISNNADAASDRALRFGELAARSAERARRAHQDLSAEVGGTSNVFNQMANAINRVTLRANALGSNVSKIDNQLRGLAVLGVIVFAQQLLTALVGLGGALVSVGSSAAFAAGAIGGTLVSGIAQALPMVGLLVAALGQVGAVSDAINQADLVKQQQFGRQQQQRQEEAAGGNDALDRANRLANANDGLKAAQDRVGDGQRRLSDANRGLADAQKELTQARQEARDNLEDLIQAEREAELAARGAALSQQEAQERLAEAVRGGDLLSLQRAELGVLEAGQGRVTARRDLREARADVAAGRDIERTPEVQAATRQVEDAKRQIEDAKRGIDDADRAVGRARRGLQAAKVDATQAGAETFAAADKLEFLLKEMTPAQRRLYDALVKIRADFKRVFTPITDIIIDSFTRGVNTADKILKSAIFLRTARDQATELAAAFDRVRIHFFEDDEKLRQIFDIMRDGTDNLRPLSRIFENVGDALLNISQAAAPAFTVLLDWFEDLSRDIRGITENHDAMEDFFGLAAKHATSWLDLVKNVGIFLAVLAGQGEAEGFSLLEDFNDAVVNATQWLRDHEEEVRVFFHEVGEVTRAIGGLIVEIAKAILEVFNPERMQTLITFIENSLLPALVFVVDKVGAWVDVFLKFLELPIVGDLVKVAIAVTLIGGVITGASGALIFFGLQIGHFLAILGRILGIFGRVNPVVGRFVGFLGAIVSKIPLLRPLAGIFGRIAAGLGVGAAAAAAGGTAAAGTSVIDDVLDIAAGPSATTPGGRKVSTVPRRGILGKLGLKKVIVEEADDVVKAADDLAVKGGTKFGTGFLSKAGGLLKVGAWTTVGVGAVNGIITGIKTGNLESGVRDMFASMSFGIVDSTKEIADKAIDEITETVKNKPIPLQLGVGDLETGGRTTTRTEVTRSMTGETTETQIVVPKLTRAQQAARDLKRMLDEIKDADPEMGKAAETMVDMFRRLEIARREKAGEGIFQGMLQELRILARRFPGLAPLAEEAADGIKEAMKKVDKFIKPRQIAVKFAFDIIDLKDKPRQFQKKIDELIAETDKLTPAGRRSVKRTIEAMVSEFVDKGHLTVDEAINLRHKVNKQWDQATEDARKKSRKSAEAAARNMLLAQRVVAAGQATMGEDAAAIFNAISLGEVKAGPLTRAAARIKQKWTGGGDPLANLRQASGGIIGMKGESGRDLIPAVLGRGEMVFNKFHQRYVQPAVQAYYGHNLEDVFKRIRGQHAGGPPTPFGFSGGYAGTTPSGNKTVPIPMQYTTGTPEFIAQSVLRTAVSLLRSYKMAVTDAFATTGHEGAGHLVSGTAMDAIPGAAGSWALVNKAVQAATSKGITVLYDGRFGSQAYPDHGEGHHAHFELGSAIGKAFLTGSPNVQKLIRLLYPWPLEGVHKQIGQAIFDRARKHGNQAVDKLAEKYAVSDGDYAPGSDAGIGADRAASIFRQAFRIAGVPMLPGFLNNLINLATEESTLNPGARNLTPAGIAAGYPEGILQVTRGTFQAYKLAGYDNPFNPLHNAIASIRYQMERYGTIVRNAPYSFGGIVGEYAEGGEIPGHENQPRPILAHGKEWVLNLAQQARVAALTGLSRESLKSMLGFHGGPTSYQGGGDTGEGPSLAQQRARINLSFTTEAEIDRIRDVLRGIFRLPAIPVTAWKEVVEEANLALQAIAVTGQRLGRRIRNLNRLIRRLRRGGVTEGEEDDIERAIDERERLQRLGRVRRQIRRVRRGGVTEKEEPRLERLEAREIRLESTDRNRFLANVNNITKDGGILDQMDEARQRRTEDMTNGLTRMTLKLRKRIAGGADIDLDMRIVDRELANARKELKDITSQRGIVTRTLRRVNNRLRELRRGGVDAGESEDFNRITNRIKKLREDGVKDDEKKEVERLKKRLEQLKKGGITEGEAAEVRRLTQQQNNLRTDNRALRDAQAEAMARVFEARKAKVQAIIDDINQEAEDREFGLGLRERLAETFGNTGALAQIASERVGSVQAQIARLQAALPRAQALGDVDMVREITQKIGDLQVSIVEIVNQQLTDAIEAVNNIASRRLGRLDLFERMATAIGAVGLGGAATVGGETLTRAGVFAQRGEALGAQRQQLQQLLRQVQITPETAQNMQLIQDLTDQLAELDVTIAENTAAAFAARVEDVNRVATFATGILDLRQRIVELTGQISQTDTADQVKALLREREGVLATQRQGLQDLLRDAESAGNKEAINDLTTQLLQNEVATLENTLAIDQLVNKDNLQTFSSSAWIQFREAIFDGLGNLLPKYAVSVPSAQAGARIQQGGLIHTHTGEVIVPAKVASSRFHGAGPTEINTEVAITSPTEVADPVILGNAIGWRIANNPNLRP